MSPLYELENEYARMFIEKQTRSPGKMRDHISSLRKTSPRELCPVLRD